MNGGLYAGAHRSVGSTLVFPLPKKYIEKGVYTQVLSITYGFNLMKIKRILKRRSHASSHSNAHHAKVRSRRFYMVLGMRTLGNFLIFFSVVWLLLIFRPFLTSEFIFRKDQIFHKTYSLDKPQGKTFGGLLKKAPPLQIDPVNTKSSIIVERINANSPLVLDVDAGNEKEYMASLLKGVAHAKGTVLPGEKGNSFMFAHSVGSPWDIARYNAVFYLLRELEAGDRVVIFRDDWRYDFRVYEKKVVEPTEVQFLTATYEEPILTLQTCWPPGTVLKRLLVFAKLEASYPPSTPTNQLLTDAYVQLQSYFSSTDN